MTGIFSALVFVVTAYLHIPTNNGYVHCGDGFIFIASCVLPMPYSISVGVWGAMFADLLTGYAIWAPGSMIIKGLLALLFTCKANKILTKRNLVMLLPATLISVVGYYLYTASLSGIPSSLIQALASSIVFVVIGAVMDKYDVKKKMLDDYIR